MAPSQIRIIHAADIHLDSPLSGLGRLGDDDLANELRKATRGAFERLVDHCIETRPDALLLAGDVYDGEWRDYSTGSYFTDRMRDLEDAGVHVVLVQGNHDAESVISRALRLPPNVHRMGTESPETWQHPDGGLVVHGQGFATKAVTKNLARDYPDAVRGIVNVGVLHTSVQGYAGHDPYAPCSVDDLVGRGYEYFALGHVHQRTSLGTAEHPVWFSGNLQGRHPRELGPKGALDVRLTAGGEAEVAFVELDVARWEQLAVDASGLDDEVAVYGAIAEAIAEARGTAGDLPLVVRVAVTGTSAAARALADAERMSAEIRPEAERRRVAVDRVDVDVRLPIERVVLPERQRALVQQVVDEAMADPASVVGDPRVRADVDALLGEVGEILRREVGLNLRDESTLRTIVERAARRAEVDVEGGA